MNFHYILFSGGLDSSYRLLQWCVEKNETEPLCPVFFNYGQYNADYEKQSAERIYSLLNNRYQNRLGPLRIINTVASLDDNKEPVTLFPWSVAEPILGKKTKSKYFLSLEIENKNMVIYSLLISFILSEIRTKNIDQTTITIHSGLRDGEMGDSSRSFFDLIKAAMNIYHNNFVFNFEFIDNIKPKTIVKNVSKMLKSKHNAKNFVKMTASCYTPINGRMPCMDCSKCELINSILSIFKENRI